MQIEMSGPVADKLLRNPKSDIALLVDGQEYRLHSVKRAFGCNEHGTKTYWTPLGELVDQGIARVGHWRLRRFGHQLRLRLSRLRWLTWPV